MSGPAEERAEFIVRLARLVSARRSLDDVLRDVLAALRPVLGCSGGSIQLVDDDGWLRLAAAEPPVAAAVLDVRIPVGSSVGGRVVLTERPVYVPDVTAQVVDLSRASSRGVRTYYGVPLVADGKAIGLLQLDTGAADAWDAEHRALAAAVAPLVAAAVQNVRAHERETAAADRSAAIGVLLRTAVEPALRAPDRETLDRARAAVAEIRGLLATDRAPAEVRVSGQCDPATA